MLFLKYVIVYQLMETQYSPQHPEDVRRQSSSQYESIWHGYADARRALYPYEVSPWENREPYNIWEDMADHLNPETATKIVDIGTNDGYFHGILRHKGFKGEFIGIDIEGKDLPIVEHIAKQRYRQYETNFLVGDAQNLRTVIETSSTPRATAGFLVYHVPKPGKVISEMHRILEPDGIGVVSTRGIANQLDTWQVAGVVAHSNGFAFPQELYAPGQFKSGVPVERISVYSHFGIEQTRSALASSPKFQLVHEHIQDRDLWIKADNVGFYNYSRAIESLLPYTVNIDTGRRPTEDDLSIMENYILSTVKLHFYDQAERNRQNYDLSDAYYKSHVNQAFFVVKAVK
jgi:SAM-dependent methyltransferase